MKDNIDILKLKLTRPDLLQCTFSPDQYNAMTDAAAADYAWKGDLKNEGTQRLSMWEEANWGKTYTAGIVAQYKNITDAAVKREKDFRASGQAYKAILESGNNCYSDAYNKSEISRVDTNDQISLSDQSSELSNYQTVMRVFQQQQADQLRREQEQAALDKVRSDYAWKGDLKNEGTQRLSMWESAHWGDIFITPTNFNQYKTYTEDSIKREKDLRVSGQAYRKLLLQYNELYTTAYISSEIDRIDKNDQISLSDQQKTIANYQTIEAKYFSQEQLVTVSTGGLMAITGLLILAWGIGKLAKMSIKEKS